MIQLLSPRHLIAMLWRRMPIILLVLIVGLPASVWFALSQPRLYEATAVIQIEAPQVAEQMVGQAVSVRPDSQIDLIQQKLMSRDSLQAVIDRLGLFAGDVDPVVQVSLLRDAIQITKLIDPAQAFRADTQPSGLVITVRLAEADQAAAVANDLVAGILREAQSRSDGRANRTLDFFVAEEARIDADITRTESDVAQFKEANAASLPDNVGPQRERLSRLLESQIALDQQLIELQTQSDRLRAEDLARQTGLLQQQRDLLTANITEIQTALDEAPEVERQLSAMTRQLDQLTTQYDVVTTRRTEAAMSQLLQSQDQTERFEVLETAIVPEYPVSASRKKIALAGGIATGLMALGLAVLLDLTGGAIRTASQLEAQLGVRPVIVVPNLSSRRQRMRRWLGWIVAFAAVAGTALAALSGRIGGLFGGASLRRSA